jgi:GDP-fucose transporter C1
MSTSSTDNNNNLPSAKVVVPELTSTSGLLPTTSIKEKDIGVSSLPTTATTTTVTPTTTTLSHDESIWKQKLKIFTVVLSYFAVSLSMVFLNKSLLTEGQSIPAPLFVTWFQCIVTSVIIAGLGELGRNAPKNSFFSQFPPFEYETETAKKVMPLTIMFVSMIALNNLCLQYVEVSFYQVARGLTTVFNVVLSYLILRETTSKRAILCCALIVAGFYLGVDNEIRFTLLGTVFGVGSSLFVCLNAMYTKKIAPVVENNQWRLSLYNNLNAVVLFPPIIWLADENGIIAQHPEILESSSYWFKMLLAGIFGFAIGIITVFQITLTSPLTHNIAGTAKATVQTMLALVIYQNPVTANGLAGIFLILLGSMLYTYVRNEEMNKKNALSMSVAGKS